MRYLLILFLIFSMISSAGYAEGIVPVLCLMGELDWDCCKGRTKIEEYEGRSDYYPARKFYKMDEAGNILEYEGRSDYYPARKFYKMDEAGNILEYEGRSDYYPARKFYKMDEAGNILEYEGRSDYYPARKFYKILI